MIVIRFKVKCQPGKTEQALEVFRDVIAPSRSESLPVMPALDCRLLP
jgi:hypothetical protein